MPHLLTFKGAELPGDLACQVLSFMRVEWAEGFAGDLQYRDWIHPLRHQPVHFVLAERGLVISYAVVVWKELEHAGETYRT